MPKNFTGKLTVPAAAATSLLSLLSTAGFTGSPLVRSANLQNGAATLYKGATSSVSTATGFPIAANALYSFPQAAETRGIDLAQIYLYSAAGSDIFLDINS